MRGEIGPDDPIQAADDGLRANPADQVVFVTGGGDSNWLEQWCPELARERYRIQVTHVAGRGRRGHRFFHASGPGGSLPTITATTVTR